MNKYLIIYTGGTLSMVSGKDGGTVDEKNFQYKLGDFLSNKNIETTVVALESIVDSSQMTYKSINEIVLLLENNYSAYDGFLILHGTDTMAFTYSYLKWLIWSFKKPIVLTGAIHTMDVDPGEGLGNIEKSLEFLKDNADQEVISIVMGDAVVDKGFPTKVSISDAMPYAVFSENNYLWQKKRAVLKTTSFNYLQNCSIEILVLTATTPICQQDNPLSDSLLLVVYGSGTFLNRPDIINRVKQYRHEEKCVLAISQCMGGIVDFSLYEASFPLKQLGVIEGSQMILEEAIGYLHSQCF